ncbi:MAG: nitronate monooxygenase [Armatimonas sp.]
MDYLHAPIIQAPIGSASTPELVAAVGNAGGLGMLSGTWRTPEALRALIAQTQALTTQPFGVNLVLEWDMSERLDISLEAGVPYLSFFWGAPPTELIARCHRAEATVFHTVGTVDETKAALDAGVDMLVVQGMEAGGHVWGITPLMELLPAVLNIAEGAPVVAAGGIGCAADVQTVLGMGAVAAWCGTRFLLAEEAAVHPYYQKRLIQAMAAETHLTRCFDGGWPNAPHRVLENETLRAWEAAGRPTAPHRPFEGEVVATDSADGSVEQRYTSNLPRPSLSGNLEELCLYAGTSVTHTRRVQPAAEIVVELSGA